MNEDLKRWDESAKNWAASRHREFRPLLITPVLDEILGNVNGAKILDAGCGDGIYTGYFTKKGADVTGIDGSAAMIELARQNNPGLRFEQADLLNPLPFENSSFDAILSILVLMSLSDIKTFLKESSRMLRPNRVLIVAVKHPAFSDPVMKLYKNLWEKLLGRKPHGLADNYYNQMRGRLWEKHSQAKTLPYNHRTMENYSKEFQAAGFMVETIYEPNKLPSEYLSKNPKLEYVTRLPRFLIFKLVKQ